VQYSTKQAMIDLIMIVIKINTLVCSGINKKIQMQCKGIQYQIDQL